MPATMHAQNPFARDVAVQERVRQRAYELYVKRGNEAGSEVDDWLKAEDEIVLAGDQQGDRK